MKLLPFRFFVLSIFLLFSLFSYGQEKVRTVEKASSSNGLLELVNLKVGEKIFDTENQVLAEKNWLKTLNFSLKNTSDKTMMHVGLELEIERTGKMKLPLRLPITFGQMPLKELSLNSKITPETTRTLKPNESATVSLKSKHYDALLRFMQENEIEDIARVKVFFEFIVFQDGTAWSKGHEMRQNPDNPNRWDVIGVWQKDVSLFQNRPLPNVSRLLVRDWKHDNVMSNWSTSPNFFLQVSQNPNQFQKLIYHNQSRIQILMIRWGLVYISGAHLV